MKTVERFSDRVANYVKYRPTYPPEVLAFFRSELGLTRSSILADIGSGTGISSRLFVENGNVVYGVEPNAAMRAAAEELFREFENFKSLDGTAESTGLAAASTDFVIAAQAFHWFDRAAARAEFKRILRPGGYAALIWNERQLDSTSFLREYEEFISKNGKDYREVRHENITDEVLESFFGHEFGQQSFENDQVLDFEGLKGRMASSSYMPSETDPEFERVADELRALFDKHQEQGRIVIQYDTKIYFSHL
jgi:SAM-dependent methyltransferase